MSMELSQKEVETGAVVITVAGKLMMGFTGERIVHLVEELLRDGKRVLVFDLSAVTALDSTGVGQFISSFNKIVAAGGEMRMAGATGHIYHTFQVSLLDKVFRFFPSVEEACRLS
jgi:anti-sigma B factor antagonist